MKKSILHIFASAGWGGGEQYVFDLAKRQIADGHRLTLLSANCPVITNKVKALHCRHEILRCRWHFNPFSIWKMSRMILQNNVDTVHVHVFKDAFIAAFAAKLIAAASRPKIIMTRHLVKKGKKGRLYRWLYRQLDKLIFVSELAKNEFLQGVSIPESKMTVIHNSIPECLPASDNIDYRASYELSSNCVLVGFTGRIVKPKGVELIIEIAEKLYGRNVVFFLAGSGEKEYEQFLQNCIRKKGLEKRVFLLGFIDNMTEFIAKMDIGFFPSLWRESFGLSVLEFMRAGLPVVTSNTGAQTEFVTNGKTGFTVPAEQEAMTEVLTKLIDSEKLRNDTGKNARSYYEEHLDYEHFFNRIMQVINN